MLVKQMQWNITHNQLKWKANLTQLKVPYKWESFAKFQFELQGLLAIPKIVCSLKLFVVQKNLF